MISKIFNLYSNTKWLYNFVSDKLYDNTEKRITKPKEGLLTKFLNTKSALSQYIAPYVNSALKIYNLLSDPIFRSKVMNKIPNMVFLSSSV